MVVVERIERVKPRHVAFFALLPVDPPKIYAVFFVGLVDNVKIGVPKIVAAAAEFDRLFFRRVLPYGLCHVFVHVLIAVDAVGRVQVQRDVQVFLFEFF